jgi:hypothetical protein
MADDVVQTMVERITEQFRPLRIVLFGSRARGQATALSDVDLLVVLPHRGLRSSGRAGRAVLRGVSYGHHQPRASRQGAGIAPGGTDAVNRGFPGEVYAMRGEHAALCLWAQTMAAIE